MTMQKTLHPRYSIDCLYAPRKERRKGFVVEVEIVLMQGLEE